MIAIVGGGLAGAVLAKKLHEKYIHFVWYVDNQSSASHISSGIINPITGRKFNISWNYDELVKIAIPFFGNFLSPINIEKHFKSHDLNANPQDFAAGKEKYLTVLNDEWVEVKHSFQLNVPEFLEDIYSKLNTEKKIIPEKFNYQELKKDDAKWKYKTFHFDKIIFAEGIFVKENPFFNYIDFRPNRGEAILLDIPNFHLKKVRKHGKFICSFGKYFWIGSSFENVNMTDPLTTPKLFHELTASIPYLIGDKNFKLLNHLGAIRSTTYDRRPIVGEHPDKKGLYVFNGFGTKGCSLIPYCADSLLGYIFEEKALNLEISIERVVNK